MGSAAPAMALLMIAIAWTSASAVTPASRDLPAPLPPSLPVVPGLNSDFLDGFGAKDFAQADHLHDDRYYTEVESDVRFAVAGHLHDERYPSRDEADARYLGASAKATDSDLLDGLDADSFARAAHTHDGVQALSGWAFLNGCGLAGMHLLNTGQGNCNSDALYIQAVMPRDGRLENLMVTVGGLNGPPPSHTWPFSILINGQESALRVDLPPGASPSSVWSDQDTAVVRKGDRVYARLEMPGLAEPSMVLGWSLSYRAI